MEMVDLNRAVEHVFPRHHQPQRVTQLDLSRPCVVAERLGQIRR
jgi:hypothetical protein